MNVQRIRGFLLQQPRPHVVRVSTDGGEPQELKTSGRSYAKLSETIIALGHELIECLDSEGKVIRAHRLTSADTRSAEPPALPAVISQDPQAAMLMLFANLLHRAYEHSTEVAFTKMVEFVERMGDRSDSIEQRLERTEAANRRLVQDQVDDALERAAEQAAEAAQGGNGGLLQQMAGAFMSGQMQNAASKPPVKANGAKHPPNGKGQA